jgi:hypothetical protein
MFGLPVSATGTVISPLSGKSEKISFPSVTTDGRYIFVSAKQPLKALLPIVVTDGKVAVYKLRQL